MLKIVLDNKIESTKGGVIRFPRVWFDFCFKEIASKNRQLLNICQYFWNLNNQCTTEVYHQSHKSCAVTDDKYLIHDRTFPFSIQGELGDPNLQEKGIKPGCNQLQAHIKPVNGGQGPGSGSMHSDNPIL